MIQWVSAAGVAGALLRSGGRSTPDPVPPRPHRRSSRTRCLTETEEPMAAPSHAGEPGPCPGNRRRIARTRARAAPTVEPPRGRSWVEPDGTAHVLAPVGEHVDERVPYLARRRERARMVAVAPDRALACEHAVHRARDADREPLHAAGGRAAQRHPLRRRGARGHAEPRTGGSGIRRERRRRVHVPPRKRPSRCGATGDPPRRAR